MDVGLEDQSGEAGYLNGWTVGLEESTFRAHFLRPEGPAIQIA